ncbi:BZ3500_MvSof-1268-A1-R1_Chr3-3g06601 [Microbotryum saponariae]|uniref:BZ3500_MvSof-1268-A1-R1_Chr3-3g06601 protein n=1 Tax=Microbotryum saponariae TaxID=289078 RepID=A0A2X0L040_9BASI|nr:BZ3500_MvSof-1268-A1-R1_Chr3-3g06601 [Microbotryum saponariae]SDA04568.1 BZ3501_MvSof-1269-A2-R1_Chr3-2g06288 [Microbotryum saponariae]
MGISLRMLLDKREPFFPYSLAAFFWKLPLCTLLYYKECEQIWQAVGEATWVELVAYKDALAQYNAQRDAQLRQQSSWNILSSEMWIAWREQWATRSRAGSDRNKIIQDTGIALHWTRELYIKEYNSRHPELDPPLRRSDNLNERLPDLPSIERDRRALMFERGIRLDGSEDIEFENTVDTRAMIIPDDSEIIGVPALLPPSSGGSGHPRPCHRAPAARMEGKRVVPV